MNKSMQKIKLYRVLGWLLFVYGIGYLVNLLCRGFGVALFFYPKIFVAIPLLAFVLNIFIWAGSILLWRADRNESPDKKSIWLKFIRMYIICSFLAVIAAMIIIPYLTRGLRG